MDQNQINIIQPLLNSLKEIDIQEKLSNHFAEQAEIASIVLQTMTVSEFIVHFKKAIDKLDTVLNTEKVHFIPFTYNYQNDFGNGTLQSLLTNIFNLINNNDYVNAQKNTSTLIHYEIVNGIYEEPRFPKNYLRIEKINDSEERIELLSKQMGKYSKEISTSISTLEDATSSLKDFQETKQNELQNITNLVTTATSQVNEITELLNKSTQHQTQITSILEQQGKLLENSNQLLKEQQGGFKEYNSTLESLMQDVNGSLVSVSNQVKEFDKKLEFVESKKTYFEERNKYLNDLIGKQVGTDLFLTFNNRKDELKTSVRLWGALVFVAAGLAVAAIFFVFNLANFTQNVSDGSSLIRFFLFNSLKTVPFIYLLYFSIVQFTRERTYQEEYAFKSAVALTINAYRELVEDPEKKDKFVIESVLGIYNPPIEGKMGSLGALRRLSKILKEMGGFTKSLNELKVSVSPKDDDDNKKA